MSLKCLHFQLLDSYLEQLLLIVMLIVTDVCVFVQQPQLFGTGSCLVTLHPCVVVGELLTDRAVEWQEAVHVANIWIFSDNHADDDRVHHIHGM